MERTGQECSRLYTPFDDHAQASIEARIYFSKWNTIVLRRDRQFAVFVGGVLHSLHDTPMAADLALRGALGEV